MELGKAPSTLAGQFVREEIEHIRHGLHGARSTKQAIAIGLSKARRAGVKLPAPAKGKTTEATRRKAEQDLKSGAKAAKAKRSTPSRQRSRATTNALKREGQSAASKSALSRQGRSAAKKRTRAERSASAKRAAQTRAKNR
jgi:hypothetical protein